MRRKRTEEEKNGKKRLRESEQDIECEKMRRMEIEDGLTWDIRTEKPIKENQEEKPKWTKAIREER